MIPTRLGQVVDNGVFGGLIRRENSIDCLIVSRNYHYENHYLGISSRANMKETSATDGIANTGFLLECKTPGIKTITDLYPKWFVPSIVELSIILRQFPSNSSNLNENWFNESSTENYFNLTKKFSVPSSTVGCESLELVLGEVPLEFSDPELFSSTVVSSTLLSGYAALVSLVKFGFVYPVSSRFNANLRLITTIEVTETS